MTHHQETSISKPWRAWAFQLPTTREYHVKIQPDSGRPCPCRFGHVFTGEWVNVGRVNKVEVELIGDRCFFLSVDTSCTIPLYGKGLLIAGVDEGMFKITI